ncbi:MAG: acetylglutamate kinase [Oscillospiraceae bacterium]
MEKPQIGMMADVMGEAMPYLQKYKGQTIVVKYGGSAMTDPALKAAVMSDLILLSLVGIKVVLVHGGGPEINRHMERLGMQSQFINGLRVTDAETMEIVQQMLAGKVNKDLVSLLCGQGVGLCGMDGGMLTCRKMQTEPDLGYVGEIQKVDTTLLQFALDSGFIPVLATIGSDENGTAYNINADTVACEVAVALQASKLVNMTDVAGLLRDKEDENSLIADADIDELDSMIEQGIVGQGMIPKVLGCRDCVLRGVHEAAIIDGRVPHSILLEIFSDTGSGTLFYKS